jgi:hypothetical protein
MRAPVVDRDDLHILMVAASVEFLVFNPQVREMDLVVEVREVVVAVASRAHPVQVSRAATHRNAEPLEHAARLTSAAAVLLEAAIEEECAPEHPVSTRRQEASP